MRSKFLCLCILAFATHFASPIEASFVDNYLSIEQIINYPNCIKEISGNKIYLNTDSIYISDNGLHLILNEQGDTACIQELYSDDAGCFVSVNITAGQYVEVRRECPHCHQMYIGWCKNPDCPFKKNRDNK